MSMPRSNTTTVRPSQALPTDLALEELGQYRNFVFPLAASAQSSPILRLHDANPNRPATVLPVAQKGSPHRQSSQQPSNRTRHVAACDDQGHDDD